MQIMIKLYGPLEKYTCQKGIFSQEIMPDISLRQLQELLGVPSSSVGLMVVNRIKRDIDYRLEENDEVKIFPFIAGG